MALGPNRPGAPDNAREAPLAPALEKLAELVRQAEAKTRARKIEGETQHAAEQFRAAELRARRSGGAAADGPARPACARSSRPTTTSSCSRTWCASSPMYKSSLTSEADAERLIAASQAEIERTRRQTRVDLEERDARGGGGAARSPAGDRSVPPAPPRDRPAPARAGRAVRRRGPAALGRRGPLPRRPAPAPGARGRRRPERLRLAGQARAVRPAQGLDRPVPLLPGVARPRRRDDRGAPGAVAPGVPPAQVPVPPVRARLHRGVPPGLLDRLGGLCRRGPGATGPGHRERPPQPRGRVPGGPRSRARRASAAPGHPPAPGREPSGRRPPRVRPSDRPAGPTRPRSSSSSPSSRGPASPRRASTSSWTSSGRPSRTSASPTPSCSA